MVVFALAAAALAQDCQGACERMMACSGANTPEIVAECVVECRASAPDAASLAFLEQAVCGAAPAPAAAGVPSAEPVAAGVAPTQPVAAGVAPTQPVAAGVAPAGGACPAPAAKGDVDRFRLLTGTAWCSFSFANGVTKRSRVVFSMDGVVSVTDGSESIQSGRSGTYASASSSGERACWKLEGQLLSLSGDGATWTPAPLTLSYNSNGSPIFRGEDGTEYMTCQ